MSRDEEHSPLLGTPPQRVPPGGKFFQILSAVTVEPALILFSFGHLIDSIYLPQISIDKICSMAFNFSEEICSHLDSGTFNNEENAVQKVASRYNIYRHWIELFPALITLLPLGAWGDIRDRKTPIIISFLGAFLSALLNLANVYWWSLPPFLTYLSYIPVGLTGSFLSIFMTTNAYISDITDTRSRTLRISILDVVKYVMYPAGIYIALAVFVRGGYVAVYAYQAAVFGAAILYLLIRLEKRRPKASEDNSKPRSICEVLRPSRIKHSFALLWKKREDGHRPQILGCVVIICLFIFNIGVKNLYYQYTQERFSWDEKQFSTWNAVDNTFHALGTVVIIPIISYYMRVPDSLIVFIGGISNMFYYVIIGTAPKSWVLYIASLTSSFFLMVPAGAKGRISKLVESNELGVIFADVSLISAVMPLLSSSFYSLVYNATLEVFPGALFEVLAGFCVPICCISV